MEVAEGIDMAVLLKDCLAEMEPLEAMFIQQCCLGEPRTTLKAFADGEGLKPQSVHRASESSDETPEGRTGGQKCTVDVGCRRERMKPMWVVVQLDDFTFRRAVYDKVNLIVQEMSGETVKAGSLCDLVVLARFPHRKYRTVEKAVAVALNTLPVKRTTVMAQDPFVLREKTFGLTKELFERQDEVLGV